MVTDLAGVAFGRAVMPPNQAPSNPAMALQAMTDSGLCIALALGRLDASLRAMEQRLAEAIDKLDKRRKKRKPPAGTIDP